MASASEASQHANRAGMDPKRLVIIFYLVAGVVLALFFEHLLSKVWAGFGWSDPEVIEGLGWKVSSLLGMLVSAGSVITAYLHPVSQAFSIEVATELMRVTWPSWAETRASTLAVVVASMVAAVLLFGIDSVAYQLMVEWLPTLWGKL